MERRSPPIARRVPRPGAAPSAKVARRRASGAEELVLVVDDYDDNREIYRAYLEAHGYRVAEARDGKEAIRLAAELAPRAIVMDLAMPGLDGWEATRQIRALPHGRDVHIIALSGCATCENRDLAIRAGCNEFIAKPCLPSELAASVALALARRV